MWKDYWERFNTMTISLQDEDAYFADAVAAAKVAQNRDHLEELLAQKHEERCRELQKVADEIFSVTFSRRTRMPSETIRLAGLKVSSTGTLDSLLQFVCGVIFGWKGCEGDDNTRGDAEDENGGAIDVQNGPEAHGGPDEREGDPFEDENRFPEDMLPEPNWAQGDEDCNYFLKHRVYGCDERDDTYLEDGSPAATERGEEREEAASTRPSLRSETSRTSSTPDTLPPPSPRWRDWTSSPDTKPSTIGATPSPDKLGTSSTAKGRKRELDTGENRGVKRKSRDHKNSGQGLDGEHDLAVSPAGPEPRTGQSVTRSHEANASQISEGLYSVGQSSEQVESTPAVALPPNREKLDQRSLEGARDPKRPKRCKSRNAPLV